MVTQSSAGQKGQACLQGLVQVPELVGIAHHVDCCDLPIVDLKGGRLEFAISFSGHEARQAVDQGGADQGRPVLAE